jgi:hypothetical protein
MGMNVALESFRTTPPISIDINHLPDGVDIQSKTFDRTAVRVVTGAGTEMRQTSQYWLLNALGSKQVPDGKYLYNPATQAIEIQWVQGIGSDKAPAPQARLMATVISGILNQRLPWGLVLLGVFMVVAIELLGIRSLSFAVGFYISIGTTCAMFIGGIVRWLVERQTRKAGKEAEESEIGPGSLFSSGLIAAGGIVGLLGIALNYLDIKMRDSGHIAAADQFRRIVRFGSYESPAGSGQIHYRLAGLFGGGADAAAVIIAVLTFAALAFSLYHFARKPLDTGDVKR